MCWWLWWLILCISLAAPWCQDIWSSTTLDVPRREFWMKCKFKLVEKWSRLSSIMWVGLIQSDEGLTRRKGWPSWSKRKFSQQTACGLHLQCCLLLVHQQVAFGLELQLFPESPAGRPPPPDFGFIKSTRMHELIPSNKSISFSLYVCVCACVHSVGSLSLEKPDTVVQ